MPRKAKAIKIKTVKIGSPWDEVHIPRTFTNVLALAQYIHFFHKPDSSLKTIHAYLKKGLSTNKGLRRPYGLELEYSVDDDDTCVCKGRMK